MAEQARKQVDPAQRAMYFAQGTRKHDQMLASQTVKEQETVVFTLPKTRLLSRVRLMVEATVTVKHASATTYEPAVFAPFTLLRNVMLDVNNGFNPFSVDGKSLNMYNLMRFNANTLQRITNGGRGKVVQELKASASGAKNKIRFVADLPVVVNERDPIGLILLQNLEGIVSLTIDIGKASDLLKQGSTGYEVTLDSMTVAPELETFTIPAHPDAFPDIAVLKLVNSQSQTITSIGEQTVHLPVGTTYRRFAFYIEDENGNGMTDEQLGGNIELVFNQADTPVRITPKHLSAINHEQLGYILPDGLFVFDFSYNGIIGLGGARDYIDTERLTEFWLKFNSPAKGKITIVRECLARLRG